MGQQMKHHESAALNHAENWRFFFRHCAASGLAFTPASTAFSSLSLDHLGLPFMACYPIGFIALHLVESCHWWLFFTMPPRNSVVIKYASLSLMDNSWAICSFDKLSPMK